jgi:rubrerythrin
MSEWLSCGITERVYGKGKNARTVSSRNYQCPNCGRMVKVELSQKPPRYCPNCGKDQKENE